MYHEAVDGGDAFADASVTNEGFKAVGGGVVASGIVVGCSLALATSSPSPTTAISSMICLSIPATLSLFFKFPDSFVPLM